jgi:hypothetical protein
MPGSNAGITNAKHCQGSPWRVPAEHCSLGGEEELFCICIAIVALHLHCYSLVFFCSNKNRWAPPSHVIRSTCRRLQLLLKTRRRIQDHLPSESWSKTQIHVEEHCCLSKKKVCDTALYALWKKSVIRFKQTNTRFWVQDFIAWSWKSVSTSRRFVGAIEAFRQPHLGHCTLLDHW